MWCTEWLSVCRILHNAGHCLIAWRAFGCQWNASSFSSIVTLHSRLHTAARTRWEPSDRKHSTMPRPTRQNRADSSVYVTSSNRNLRVLTAWLLRGASLSCRAARVLNGIISGVWYLYPEMCFWLLFYGICSVGWRIYSTCKWFAAEVLK